MERVSTTSLSYKTSRKEQARQSVTDSYNQLSWATRPLLPLANTRQLAPKLYQIPNQKASSTHYAWTRTRHEAGYSQLASVRRATVAHIFTGLVHSYARRCTQMHGATGRGRERCLSVRACKKKRRSSSMTKFDVDALASISSWAGTSSGGHLRPREVSHEHHKDRLHAFGSGLWLPANFGPTGIDCFAEPDAQSRETDMHPTMAR